ncbi:MAG: MOSC domain-containing protein, partial [Planctomycetota bacterium]
MSDSPYRVHTLSIGREQTFTADDGREMTSAIRKVPQEGAVRLTLEGFDGDGTSHPAHGGPSMRVHAFRHEHYAFFEERAGRSLPPPVFGENLTLSGYGEEEARAGDVLRIGKAVLRVTQPTERCGTIGRSAGVSGMLDWIQESLHTGFYLSVVEEGDVAAG